MPDKKIVFNKDTFDPLFTVSKKRSRKREGTRELVTLSKHASNGALTKFSLSIPERLTSSFACDRYEIQASKEVLAFFPSKNGYAVSKVKKTHRLQFAAEEDQVPLLSHACGSYKLCNDQNVLYIIFSERVEENEADRIAAPDDLPVPVELPTPEPLIKQAPVKKIDLVVAPPIGRQYIGDKNVLKLLDEIDRKGYVSIRDADRLGIKNYPNAVKALTLTYGYATVSVPVVSEKNRVVFVTTLYNGDGEWKE